MTSDCKKFLNYYYIITILVWATSPVVQTVGWVVTPAGLTWGNPEPTTCSRDRWLTES